MRKRRRPGQRLTVERTITALVQVMDGGNDAAWRLRQVRDALIEHLKAIAYVPQRRRRHA